MNNTHRLRRIQVLKALGLPFPPDVIQEVQGNKYVPHSNILFRVASVLGRPPDQDIQEILYDDGGRVCGVVVDFTFYLPDGEAISISEVGDSGTDTKKKSGEGYVHNNAGRVKSGVSDAFRRAAMRLLVSAHLWSKSFSLFQDFEQFSYLVADVTDELKVLMKAERLIVEDPKAKFEALLDLLYPNTINRAIVTVHLSELAGDSWEDLARAFIFCFMHFDEKGELKWNVGYKGKAETLLIEAMESRLCGGEDE